MKKYRHSILLAFAALAHASSGAEGQQDMPDRLLCIGGIYPSLAVFNKPETVGDSRHANGGAECGIGAVVPWAGKLWLITYPPHSARGSSDRLWTIDESLRLEQRPESVGGTHASRMIHRESNQLIIGPYFIDSAGAVRAADVNILVGRMTAAARHLADPANWIYFIDMEGAIYETNVHTLETHTLFHKPFPGDHAKGGYTGQGRLVVSNNGERKPAAEGEYGVLAEWSGHGEWRVVERKQFTDVTGPGGIEGAPNDAAPLWAIGWDRRSVILKLLDRGEWSSFRLPKASHAYDPAHGWYTEWPRIRETGQGRMLMDMHGMFYDFPKEFRTGRTNGLRPIASHLRYIPDFCDWNGRLVLAADDASMMQNPMVGQPQSNLWFGSWSDLPSFGPRSGWGGPWSADLVKANEPSDPFLIDGFDRRVLHLAHDSDRSVDFSLEIDAAGDGRWRELETLAVPANGYRYRILDPALEASWMRLRASADCRATAYFHLNSNRADDRAEGGRIAAGIAGAADRAALSAGLIRPAGHNTNLQFLARRFDADGAGEAQVYYEVDERISFLRPAESRAEEVERIACIAKDFETDAASVVMVWQGRRYRLPKGGSAYDKPFAFGWPRGMREVQSERYLANIHGTFYEIPRDDGVPMIKPVCTHGKQIMDFCSWRGLLVLSGALASARPDGRHFASEDRHVGLWFGAVDDLWKLGKPVGCGGPWKETPVLPGQPSDPYLMTGYDRKRLLLSHDSPSAVAFLLEVDVDHNGWLPCETFAVEPGQTIRHDFPEGFGAHWARLTADKACAATAIFQYE